MDGLECFAVQGILGQRIISLFLSLENGFSQR